MVNIRYKSEKLLAFYKKNRQRWDDLYPSEKFVFRKIAEKKKNLGDILDVGCACGGLSSALKEKVNIRSYAGVDINTEVISWAEKNFNLGIPYKFFCADIVSLKLNRHFDTVISLGCVDWNIETKKIIKACWQRVKNNGYLVISLRLTRQKGVNNIKRSYQYINFTDKKEGSEKANYAVLNFKKAINLFKKMVPPPGLIGAYGYFGKPSLSAVTPYKKILFAVFYLQKLANNPGKTINFEFNFPKCIK